VTKLEGVGKHRGPARFELTQQDCKVWRLLFPLQQGLAHKEVLQSMPHALG